MHDSGVHDSGVHDSGVRDSGVRDSGVRDSGVRDSSDQSGDMLIVIITLFSIRAEMLNSNNFPSFLTADSETK